MNAREFQFDAVLLREFARAQHHAGAGTVDEAHGGHVHGEFAAAGRREQVDLREFPHGVGIGGGDFALPEQGAAGRVVAGSDGARAFARAPGDEFLRAVQIWRGIEEMAEVHHFEGLRERCARGEQDELPSGGADLFLEADQHAHTRAVDGLDIGALEQAMAPVREQLVHENGVIADGDEIDGFGQADGLPVDIGADGFADAALPVIVRAGLELPPLAENADAKKPAVLGHAEGRKAGRFPQAEKPAGPFLQRREGGGLDGVQEKIERGANADANGHAERAVVHGDPFFLRLRPEGDEEDVRLGGGDLPQHFAVGHLNELPEGRRIMAGDDEFGMAGLQAGDGAFRGFRRRAEQEHAIAVGGGDAHQQRRNVLSRDATGQGIAEQAGRPEEGSAIAEHEVGLKKDAAQFHVLLRVDQKTDVRRDQMMRAAGTHHARDQRQRFLRRQIIERHAQNGDGRIRQTGLVGGTHAVAINTMLGLHERMAK